MANTQTVNDICNLALDLLGALNIQDINDTMNPNSVICKRHYGQCVKAELDKYEWYFARRWINTPVLVDYTQHPNAEVKGYYAYFLPSDFSRLSQYFFGETYPYRKCQYDRGHTYFITDKYLYTRYPIDTIPYISNVVPIADYDTLFVDVVSAALATRMAKKIAGSDADIAFLDSVYNKMVSTARRKQVLQMEPSGTGATETQYARVGYYGI